MKRGSPIRIRAIELLLCACAVVAVGGYAYAQTDPTVAAQSQQLLGKAHALEVRGRMDMAKQTWKQVLLIDPKNTEALAGMARAAKLENNTAEYQENIEKLRAINPNDPNIAKIENMGTALDANNQLQEAGRLAQQGQYARAMQILRQVYGTNPPPGDAALSYYQTEAATDDGRPHAIAGLRALVDKYPADSRYQIALGKILTYNPRTRAEGRKLLEKHPNDPDAADALKQSLLWDAQNPATAGDIKAYLSRHPDQQLNTALQQEQAATKRAGGRPARQLTPEEQAAQAAYAARSAEEQAAYNALNAKHYDDAEARFKVILTKTPNDWQALAGMGYLRMNQQNFGGAISYLEQAKQDGAKDPAVEKALTDSRFYYTMQTATAALNQSDLVTAQQQFTAALHMRPNDPEALLGLGGTLLKAQQADAAIPVFVSYIKVAPNDMAAWRGLFMAQYGAGKYNDALATDKRIPVKLKPLLMKDPDYLRTLASVYLAVGRDADAQRVLKSALDLPFPPGGHGLKEDIQTQFAALLVTAGHREQALGLYQQVLAEDQANTNAWVGVVQVEHQLGHDPAAFQALQQMPSDQYQQSMQEPGFETTVAAIYESQGHDDLAQQVLVKFIAKQQAEGRKPFIPAEIQLAGIYMRQGDSANAYPLYQMILTDNPKNPDAWNGLLGALHAAGHDQDALAELQQIPPDVRRDLETNPAYLQTVGSIYAGLNQPQEAMLFLNRAEQHYKAQHAVPPAEIDIQTAWLLYNAHNDTALYAQLMMLGNRGDLSDQQRMTVQTIWTNFAVRRANAASARGDYRRAIAILNATAKTFPGNPDVIKALANGYASAGMPKEAVAIFRSQDMAHATAADYKAAIGAALAANDTKNAEVWLRFGLDQYPNDPQMLVLAGKFEMAIGNSNQAEVYYRQSLKYQPLSDPGMELAGELSKPAPQQAVLPSQRQPQDLATLLAQPDSAPINGVAIPQQVQARPYLPSYGGTQTQVPVMISPQQNGSPSYPVYGPDGTMQNGTPQPAPAKNSTLKDYVPQSRLEGTPAANNVAATSSAQLAAVRELRVAPEAADRYRSFLPGAGYDSRAEAEALIAGQEKAVAATSAFRGDGVTGVRFVSARYVQQSSESTPVVPYAPLARPVQHKPSPATPKKQMTQAQARAAMVKSKPKTQQVSRPQQRIAQPSKPQVVVELPVKLNSQTVDAPVATVKTQSQTTVRQVSQSSAQAQAAEQARRSARERAMAIRANQADAYPMTGTSHPAQESYDATDARLNNAQYGSGQYNAVQAPDGLTAQPKGRVVTQQQTTGQYGGQTVNQTGDSYGQQYPQPRTGGTAVHRQAAKRATTEQPAVEPPPVQNAPPMEYPVYPQPLTNQGYPQVGPAYPLGQAPSDYDLLRQNVPPLRGAYDTRVDENAPLTERQKTELDLASIEGSYSGYVGGSVIGWYRSGTPGIDRLAGLEVPFEASAVVGQGLRLTVIPTAVFLNSGQLNTNGGNLGTTPIFGSIYGTALYNPPQQFASGIGGEFQAATNTFQAAIGYTPYEFLVSNVIGRLRWRPNNGHFTFFGGRDAVKETQLSYAGMRDPGSATTTYSGNVWGGVVQTGGGVRFDAGTEKAGLYIVGEGADLSGYHVLENRKYDGTMGAYFQVKIWPEYGSLNIGGMFFGEHFDHNERPETYGLGGYFSPEAYFLAAIPLTFNGHYGTNLHYTINGSVGIQTFQEDNQVYFPLDPTLEVGAVTACETAAASSVPIITQTCGQQPVNSNTGLNYSINAEVSYRVTDHWFVGGFMAGNNTNNYNTISGGFFGRYTFRPQVMTVDYPTGLFPAESTTLRQLRIP